MPLLQGKDYQTVEGVIIAHSGQTHAIITCFGDNMKMGPTHLRMEKAWMIDDLRRSLCKGFLWIVLSLYVFLLKFDSRFHQLNGTNKLQQEKFLLIIYHGWN